MAVKPNKAFGFKYLSLLYSPSPASVGWVLDLSPGTPLNRSYSPRAITRLACLGTRQFPITGYCPAPAYLSISALIWHVRACGQPGQGVGQTFSTGRSDLVPEGARGRSEFCSPILTRAAFGLVGLTCSQFGCTAGYLPGSGLSKYPRWAAPEAVRNQGSTITSTLLLYARNLECKLAIILQRTYACCRDTSTQADCHQSKLHDEVCRAPSVLLLPAHGGRARL